MGGEDLGGVRGPGVVEDLQVAGGEGWQCFDAVFGAGAELVEFIECGKGEGDGGLQGGYAHWREFSGRSTCCLWMLHVAPLMVPPPGYLLTSLFNSIVYDG